MGCTNSKPQEPVETVVKEEPVADAAKPAFKDTTAMVCFHFGVQEGQMEAWKESAQSIHQSATSNSEMVFYGTSNTESSGHIRAGFRTSEGLMSHVQQTQTHISKTSKTSSLQKVEVHGTRSQITQVRKQITKIEQTRFEFYEMDSKVSSFNRRTGYSGEAGSDQLVSTHITVQVSTVTELRVLQSKVKCVQRRASSTPGNESFQFSVCKEAGLARIVAFCDSTESTMEHLACVVSHLGEKAIHGLEMYGPEAVLTKVKSVMKGAAKATSDAAKAVQTALKNAATKAASDAAQAAACAAAAAKAVEHKASEALKQVRDKTCDGLHAIQKKAREQAVHMYKESMKAKGAIKEEAKAAAKTAYKKAMEEVGKVRQAVDTASKAAYDSAIAAGKAASDALEEAESAAKAAAKSANDELKELAKDAQAALSKAKADAEDAAEAALDEMAAEAFYLQMSVEIVVLDVERLVSDTCKEARRAMLGFYAAVKADAIAECEAACKKARAAKKMTEEAYREACERAQGAAYAVASSTEHVYVLAYTKALQAGKEVAKAKEAAESSVKYAAAQSVALFREGEQQTVAALKAADDMARKGLQAVEGVMSTCAASVLDAANAVRKSVEEGEQKAADAVNAGMSDVAWAIGSVVDMASDALEGAAGVIDDAVNNVKHSYDETVAMVMHFDVKKEAQEDFKAACDEFHKVANKVDTVFYGATFTETGASVRVGHRHATASTAYLHQTKTFMTRIRQHSNVKTVEVHGSRKQVSKVKKQITMVETVHIEFYEAHKKMRPVRQPERFLGGPDRMVTSHVRIQVTEESRKAISERLEHVHRAARDHPGVHSLSITQSLKKGAVVLMGTFSSMEVAVHHLCVSSMHLGTEALHSLQMHAPDKELEKVKGLMGDVAGAVAGSVRHWAGMLKDALDAAKQKAEDEVLQAKAMVKAAEKAVQATCSDAVKEARQAMAGAIQDLEKEAEAASQEAYREVRQAMKAAGDAAEAIDQEVKALAKQAYQATMDAASDIRQAADEAARNAYETARDAGEEEAKAIEAAMEAAEDAAKSMKDELVDAAEAAKKELDDAEEYAKKELQVAAAKAKAAANFAPKALEVMLGQAAKQSRTCMLQLIGSLRTTSTEVTEIHYKREVHTTTKIRVVQQRCRSAAVSVVVSHEETFYVTYEKHIVQRSSVEEAMDVALKAAEASCGKAVDVWKRGEKLAQEALQTARDMVTKQEKALQTLWSTSVGFVLDSQRSLRASMYKGVAWAADEVQEGTEQVAWAVSAAMEEVSEGLDWVHDALGERFGSWYDALLDAEARGLRAIADAADSRADSVEQRKGKTCC